MIRLKGLIGQRGYMWFQKGKVCGRKVNGRSRARIVLHFVGFCHWNFIFAKKQFNNHVLLKVSAVGWPHPLSKDSPLLELMSKFQQKASSFISLFYLNSSCDNWHFPCTYLHFFKIIYTPYFTACWRCFFLKINILKNYLIYKYKK